MHTEGNGEQQRVLKRHELALVPFSVLVQRALVQHGLDSLGQVEGRVATQRASVVPHGLHKEAGTAAASLLVPVVGTEIFAPPQPPAGLREAAAASFSDTVSLARGTVRSICELA